VHAPARSLTSLAIAYARAGETDLLFDRAGQPLLPVSSDRELDALKAIAELHGATLVESEAGGPGQGRAPQARIGKVVAVGQESHSAGALYAHLTGREFAGTVDDLEALRSLAPAVVVVPADHCRFDLLDMLYGADAPGGEAVPGLIVAPRALDLPLVAKRWALGLAVAGHRPSHRTIVLPNQDFARIERPEGIFVGSAEPREGLLAAMGSESSVTLVVTHSNGLDLSLGSGANFCPFPPERELGGTTRPICLEAGNCTLMPNLTQRSAAWQSGQLSRLDSIRSQILLLFTCYGLRFVDRILAPEFGLGASLSLQATAGAIVTTFTACRSDPAGVLMYGLMNDLAAGEPIGAALRRFNMSAEPRRVGSTLCLLGDPDYHLASDPSLARLPEPPTAEDPAEQRRASASAFNGLILKRGFARNIAANFRIKTPDLVPQLEEQFAAYESALLRGTPSDQLRTLRGEINQNFLQIVAETRPFLDQLVKPFGTSGSVSDSTCGICGRRCSQYPFDFHAGNLPSIALRNCHPCASVEFSDPDVDCPIDFSGLSDNVLRLRHPLPEGRIIVAAITATITAAVPPPADYASAVLHWPRDADGELAPSFTLSGLPKGPMRLHVLAAWGDRIGMWGTKNRVHEPWPA
jgi:hypothetical protein